MGHQGAPAVKLGHNVRTGARPDRPGRSSDPHTQAATIKSGGDDIMALIAVLNDRRGKRTAEITLGFCH
ncbi:MAG: hypothetical protein JRN37_02240 [Nitrososphaerota archaeon]|nr:hypothetical protein [Nitrososphaerota archaeon]MDG7040343.1 hypothetical protein [Nitrososphaerota archaeon]MDG7042965.1 hypothetical protein [Nitrososphaerota archaeon]